jgi:hypothetical protein
MFRSFVFLALFSSIAPAAEPTDDFDPGISTRLQAPAALIPYPREVRWTGGMRDFRGWKPIVSGDAGRARGVLDALPEGDTPLRVSIAPMDGGGEAYQISVTNDGAALKASGDIGLLRGLATLRQMVADKKLPNAEIRDWPAFPMRGFMHDVGRNFQEIETLARFVGTMADYKLNVFHWHLTDKPGYRIESRRYPVLNSAKAGVPTRSPGRFYTFEQIRGLIRGAHKLGVEVLPEIDMPGHSDYFNRAFGFGMQDPRGVKICCELIDEFHAEVIEPLRKEGIAIPRLHLGADEVRITNADFLPAVREAARKHGLEVVMWRPGAAPDEGTVTQLWAKGKPQKGIRFIDSTVNYVNHMDFLDSVPHAFFWQPCGRAKGDGQALGAILCHWPDVNAGNEANIYQQSPVIPAMIASAERFWRGLPKAQPDLWAELPVGDDPRLRAFEAFERDLEAHRPRLAAQWAFPYRAQSFMKWKVYGPLPAGADVSTASAADGGIKLDGGIHPPIAAIGGTLHLRHFFGTGGVFSGNPKEGTALATTRIWSERDGEVPCWIGFNSPSTSDRRSGPVVAGQWSRGGGRVWVNGHEIPPPEWKNAGYAPKVMWDDERPFSNEGYACREPAKVRLVKGWNEVRVVAPCLKDDWKWMFTFLPLEPGLHCEP